MFEQEHHIIHVGGHYEVRDNFNRTLCSGDTMTECENELVTMLTERAARYARQTV